MATVKKVTEYAPLVLRIMVDKRLTNAEHVSLIATIGITDAGFDKYWQGDTATRIGTLRLRELCLRSYVYANGCESGGKAEYHDAYSISLREAETMVSTLRAIERVLSKAQEAQGYAATWADTLLRIALALRVEEIAIHSAVYGAANKAEWCRGDWHSDNVAGGMNALRSLLREMAAVRAA